MCSKISKILDCFSPDIVNKGRQDELDIAKGMAIIFMVWCHSLRSLGGDTKSILGYFVDGVLGGPFAAPVFMISMGIGIKFSHRTTSKYMAIRGLKLFFYAYLLNFCRYTLPTLILYLITRKDEYISRLGEDFGEVDILQFAGISFILFAFFKKISLPDYILLIIADLFSLAGTILKDVSTNIIWLDCILGIFWKAQNRAYFTLFHWFIFPVAGYFIGDLIKRCNDKKFAYLYCIIVFFPIGAIIEIILIIFGFGLTSDITEYFYMTLLDAFFLITFVVAWFGILFLLRNCFPNGKIGFLQKLSLHINSIFCIHWTIIGFINIIRELTWAEKELNFFLAIPISAAILIISTLIAIGYEYFKKKFCKCK